MAEGAPRVDTIKCGICCEEEGYIINPLRLPCSCKGVYCELCLSKQASQYGKRACNHCKEEYETPIINLPPAVETYCDPCKGNGEPKKTANTYCMRCDRKYCANHSETHQEVNGNHPVTDIGAYRRAAFSGQLRYCPTHHTEPLTMGCKTCWLIICPLCISTEKKCSKGLGGNHSFMALVEISEALTKYLEPVKQKAEDRFDDISAIVKKTASHLVDWDAETEASVKVLHKRRSVQIDAIKMKYAELETHYRASRDGSRDKVTGFSEVAHEKLAHLNDRLMTLRTEISNSHVVDLIQNRKEIKEGFNRLSLEEYPAIVIDNQTELLYKGEEVRDIEMKMGILEDLYIGPNEQERDRDQDKQCPTHIELIKQVPVGPLPTSVHHYNEYTFVGHNDGSVSRIDPDGIVTPFTKLMSRVTGIVAHCGRLYTLQKGNPYRVYVHDLTGRQLTYWNHPDHGNTSSRALTILNNRLVIANRTKKSFTIYSLTGERIQDVKCGHIFNDFMSICLTNENSLIMANCRGDYKPELYKVNFTTGKVEWRSAVVKNPIGVTMHGNHYTLVTSFTSTKQWRIWVLDQRTGLRLRELADAIREKSSPVYDMCLDGDTLIVPRYNENTILYYKLMYYY